MDPADTGRNTKWCRDTYAALQPHFGTTRYVNYLADDETDNPAIVAAYGPNYARLRELKSKFDPDNVFRTNVNIAPK
jgi:FAD/FMN-containing dehydrogenase